MIQKIAFLYDNQSYKNQEQSLYIKSFTQNRKPKLSNMELALIFQICFINNLSISLLISSFSNNRRITRIILCSG